MHKYGLMLLVCMIVLSVGGLSAQPDEATAYSWEAGDLALLPPDAWDAPLPAERDGLPTLQLAQALADAPDTRPPAIPFMTLTLIPVDDPENPPDLPARLQTALRAIEVEPDGPFPLRWLDGDGWMAAGQSDDVMLTGIGRAVMLDEGRALLMVGRANHAEQSTFRQEFNRTAESIVLAAEADPGTTDYGALWQTRRDVTDGAGAFLDPVALAMTPDGETLYLLDVFVGVIRLDATTGFVQATIPFESDVEPSDLAVAADGTVYVGDVECGCIRVLQGDRWQILPGNFAPGAPFSLTLTPTGTLYATDSLDEAIVVREFAPGGAISDLFFEDELDEQPHLTTGPGGNLLALAETGILYTLVEGGFSPVMELLRLPFIEDFTRTAGGETFIAAGDEGVLVYGDDGEVTSRVGTLVDAEPQPGELVDVRAITVDASGTLYWADSDGSVTSVMAMSNRAQTGRIGAMQLIPDLPVNGTLGEDTPFQTWIFDGVRGQQVTLTALSAGGSRSDIALRLLGPDGREVAYNDNHESLLLPNELDPQIDTLLLPQDGVYGVIVEQVTGQGSYTLGFTQNRPFELTGEAVELQGELSDLFATQRWAFEGRAGTTLTLTLRAESGTLDPLLRITDGRGGVLAENDDASDPDLVRDSQIVDYRLPYNGQFVIEASRFEGSGRYTLSITLEE